MTVDDVITEIRVNVDNQDANSIPESRVLAAINSAIDELEMENPWFQTKDLSMTLVVDEPNLLINDDWPTDFLSEMPDGGLTLLLDQQHIPLMKIGLGEYDRADIQVSGIPRWYTTKADAIHVLPYPDTAYTIKLRYFATQANLTAGQDNGFTTNGNFVRAVKFLASADLLLSERKDIEKHDVYLRRAGMDPNSGATLPGGLLSKLKRLTNLRRSGGYITPHGVMPGYNYRHANYNRRRL